MLQDLEKDLGGGKIKPERESYKNGNTFSSHALWFIINSKAENISYRVMKNSSAACYRSEKLVIV